MVICYSSNKNLMLLLLLLSHFSCVWLCATPPGSPIPGILQARTLEWVAISFSNAWKWKVKVKSLSFVQLLATPWTVAYQAPPSIGFSRQEYWSGVPLPSPKNLITMDKLLIHVDHLLAQDALNFMGQIVNSNNNNSLWNWMRYKTQYF